VARRPARAVSAPGALVYVMGPSGAGKDSLLRFARARLAGTPVMFAHRYATRPASAGDENEVPLLPAEFDRRLAAGLFAFHWPAHGVRYALGAEVEAWRARGLAVVVSGSRAHFNAGGSALPGIVPVVVTATPAVLAGRLAGRAREDAAAVAARLERGAAHAVAHPLMVTIDNSGALEDAGAQLVALLSRLAAEGVAGS